MNTRRLFLLFLGILTGLLKEISCQNDNETAEAQAAEARLAEALDISQKTLWMIAINLYLPCVHAGMAGQQFLSDDLQSFVNYPSKTTVGFAPKFTGNRKFFANMITTTAFKKMLEKDENELRRNFVKKLRYCDSTIMDQEIVKELYSREVDQTKI